MCCDIVYCQAIDKTVSLYITGSGCIPLGWSEPGISLIQDHSDHGSLAPLHGDRSDLGSLNCDLDHPKGTHL